MHSIINFQGNKSPVIIILHSIINFQGNKSPVIISLLPRATVSLVKRAETAVVQIYYLYQFFWQGD